MEARSKAGALKRVMPPMRSLASGAIAIAALFVTGFVTQAEAQSSSTITVRARGTAGGESITLRVNNTNVATWSLSTSFQNYSASTTLSGGTTVAFTNDGTGRDVQVDFITVNGQTRQAEAQSFNTGLFANGQCGGGSNSEWMHCNGAIGFGDVGGGPGPTPTPRPAFFVGNITTNGAVRSDFTRFWNQITPENEG